MCSKRPIGNCLKNQALHNTVRLFTNRMESSAFTSPACKRMQQASLAAPLFEPALFTKTPHASFIKPPVFLSSTFDFQSMFLDANMHFILKLFWLCILVHRSLVSGYTSSVNSSCHCIPGDDCWPSLSEWADLNSSVHGRLIATESLAAPCHLPTFNATTCSVLKTKWDIAGLQ